MHHVLVCFEYPTVNGGENSWLATLPYLVNRGIQISAFAPASGPLSDLLRSAGISIVDATNPNPSASHSLAGRREQLAAAIRRVRPQVVHGNSLAMSRMTGPVAKSENVSGLGHLRDILNLSRAAIADLNQLTHVLGVSHAVVDHHVSQGLRPDITTVLHNGIDTDRFQPRAKTGEWHDRWGIPRDRRLVATIGQIGMRKGLLDGFAAFHRCTHRMHNLDWVVIGERHSQKEEAIEYELELHRRVAASDLRSRIHFVGRLDEVETVLPECDVLLHSARQEPLGRVLLEAAACGVPVVATDVGGTREIFASERHGALLIPAGDVEGLARALLRILADEQLHTNLSQGGRQRVCEAFPIEQAAKRLANVYQELSSWS